MLYNTYIITTYQIIYVDSNSSDNSVQIAKDSNVEIIKITDAFTTASLGRYLGLKYSKYNNLLFIDSDMYLDKDWLNKSYEYFIKYGAIIGERYEKLYRDDKVIKEMPNFYNIKKVEISSNIGGFLMIQKDIIANINYTPIIRNEEEKDFYAKFYDKNKIYRIPISAYIHNNYNLSASRIKDYLLPYNKNGYIISFFSAMKNKYIKNYMQLQSKYIVSVLVSLLFYFSIVSGNLYGYGSLLFLFINGRKQLKGSIMTAIFFPYKFLMSIYFLKQKLTAKYIYQNREYEIEIKI
jgi:hypothetical protein